MKNISLITLAILLQSCNTTINKTTADNKLTGSWSIVADQLIDSGNHVIKQDTNVTGLLIYLPDGKMSVQILWKGLRNSMINDTIMKQDGMSAGLGLGFNTWSTDQARKIIDTYDSYFGDYSVDWNTSVVTHIVSGNLRPEKEGTSYKRIFQLKGDSLFLRSIDPHLKWQVACVKNKK